MSNLNLFKSQLTTNNKEIILPSTQKALRKHDMIGDKITIDDIPMPTSLDPYQVLVKVQSAAISPQDRLYANGMYGYKRLQTQPPVGIGFEGSGCIVKIGSSIPKKYLQTNISFIVDPHVKNFVGAYAEYIVLDRRQVPWNGDINQDKASLLLSNPISALTFLEYCLEKKSKCMLQTAAAGALGIMVIKLFKKWDIEVINIVKGNEDYNRLKEIKAKNILNSEDPTFTGDLIQLIKKLKPTVMTDAVGGSLLSDLVVYMPPTTDIYCFGWLSQEPSTIPTGMLVMHEKNLKTYWAKQLLDISKHGNGTPFDMQKCDIKMAQGLVTIMDDLECGGEIFGINIACTGALKDWEELFKNSEKYATYGKTIMNPHSLEDVKLHIKSTVN